MRSKGHRQSRFHGSLQGFLQLFLIQITVFSAASCADPCIPVNLTETSYNTTSVTLSWIVPKDKNNTFISFVSLFSSANKTQNYTTTNKELTITGLSPSTTYSVSISSLCNGTESIPSIIVVQTGPSPPLDIMVVEQDIAFASVRWTAPNDPNKDSYTYHVKLYLNGYWMNYEIVHSTEVNFTHLVPGRNYTLTVTSSCNNKASQPATITFIAVPCGGKVRAEGWLSSPGYPQNIYSNMDCVWDIEAPLGHIVLLTVVDLNYYYYYYYHYPSSWCYSSWLALGYTQTSHRDITMCRYSDIGRTITSPSNTLRVFYQTSFFSQTRRFNITLSSQDACIPTNLTETSFNTTSVTLSWFVPKDQNNMLISVVSLFSSASKTQKYTTTNKELTITGLSPGSNYSVSISSLCNGTESIPSTIAVQTGPSPPLNITVAKQDWSFASVKWTAPNDPNKDSYTYRVMWYLRRYSMNYKTVYNTEINITRLVPGGNYTLTVTSYYNNKYSLPATITFTAVPCGGKVRAEGWLSSPGYPRNIYSNMDCVWDIEAPLGHVVLLTVVDLNSYYNNYYYYSSSRCYRGWLAVGYNQTSQRDITMCRYSDVGRTIISPSNTMRVFYYTSSYYGTRRFNVALSSQDSCIPAQLKVVSYNITSVTLSWIIPNDRNNTQLSFVSLLSSGKEIQNYTTMYKEQTITGLSPFIEYNVSISSLCHGTESIPSWINIETGPSPPTNLTVVEEGVGFASVRWTAPNDPNKDSYTYHVTLYHNGYSMNSRTVHSTEFTMTYLEPGYNYTVTVTSSDNNKASLPATITFTAVPCGGQLRAEGRLSSPDNPQNIYSNLHCFWDIEAPLGHVVLLTVVDLNYYYYYPSSECYGNWLAVGYNQTSQKDITMCHYSDVGRTIISTSNMLRVFYRKSFYYDAVRFNITLSSQEDPSLSSTASAGTEAGTDTTAIKSTSSVSTVESSTHPTSNTVKPEESSPSSSGVTQVGTDTTSHATHLTSTAVVVLLSIAAKVFCDSMGLT
uniref:Uncharacterized protein n=1 Tax=Eptatretus burgeri TaxID=7764 RepID=A0A8C4Q7T9_EPTBU